MLHLSNLEFTNCTNLISGAIPKEYYTTVGDIGDASVFKCLSHMTF